MDLGQISILFVLGHLMSIERRTFSFSVTSISFDFAKTSFTVCFAEIAESLAKDMQDEKLHRRTLTLKLKTAGFEVRTRVVSLQKYICSKDEILNFASKLLMEELPLSLRLIGMKFYCITLSSS